MKKGDFCVFFCCSNLMGGLDKWQEMNKSTMEMSDFISKMVIGKGDVRFHIQNDNTSSHRYVL